MQNRRFIAIKTTKTFAYSIYFIITNVSESLDSHTFSLPFFVENYLDLHRKRSQKSILVYGNRKDSYHEFGVCVCICVILHRNTLNSRLNLFCIYITFNFVVYHYPLLILFSHRFQCAYGIPYQTNCLWKLFCDLNSSFALSQLVFFFFGLLHYFDTVSLAMCELERCDETYQQQGGGTKRQIVILAHVANSYINERKCQRGREKERERYKEKGRDHHTKPPQNIDSIKKSMDFTFCQRLLNGNCVSSHLDEHVSFINNLGFKWMLNTNEIP